MPIKYPQLNLIFISIVCCCIFFSCVRKHHEVYADEIGVYDGKYDGLYCGVTMHEHDSFNAVFGAYVTVKDTFDICHNFKLKGENMTFEIDGQSPWKIATGVQINNLPDTIGAYMLLAQRSYDYFYLIPKEKKLIHIDGFNYSPSFRHDTSILIMQ